MKKTLAILTVIAATATAPVFAGEKAQVTDIHQLEEPILPRYEKQPYNAFVRLGVMHTSVRQMGSNGLDSKAQSVPSLLYGCTVGGNWNCKGTVIGDHTLTHVLGAYTGFYSGSIHWVYDRQSSYEKGKVDVDVIPLTLSYDLNYELTDSVSIFGGVRTGAMIRTTTLRLEYKPTYHSQKTVPKAGVGVGAQLYLTEHINMTISYDFEYTFGDDCNINLKKSDSSHRYYGTVNIGAAFSF